MVLHLPDDGFVERLGAHHHDVSASAANANRERCDTKHKHSQFRYNPVPGNSTEILALLDSPRLLRWFAQNPGHVHPKLQALPIGLENNLWGRLGSPKVMAEVLLPQVQNQS